MKNLYDFRSMNNFVYVAKHVRTSIKAHWSVGCVLKPYHQIPLLPVPWAMDLTIRVFWYGNKLSEVLRKFFFTTQSKIVCFIFCFEQQKRLGHR